LTVLSKKRHLAARTGRRKTQLDNVDRFGGTPEEYPGNGDLSLADAYKELSRTAFAVWVRLMASSEEELGMGRRKLAIHLDYGKNQCNVLLRELRDKGFISMIPQPGRITRFAIERRAIITNRANFQRPA